MDDDLLLAALLELDIGTMANALQAAQELPGGTLSERLAKGYFEVTAQGFDENGEVGLD